MTQTKLHEIPFSNTLSILLVKSLLQNCNLTLRQLQDEFCAFFHYLLSFWLLFEPKEPIDYPLLDILRFPWPASQASQ